MFLRLVSSPNHNHFQHQIRHFHSPAKAAQHILFEKKPFSFTLRCLK